MNNTTKYVLEHTMQSRRGDRAENQDCAEHYTDDKQAIFIVADGLGGHKNGRFAARYFSERFIYQAKKHHSLLYHNPELIIKKIFTLAEHDLLTSLKNYPDGMDARTTCVVAYSSDRSTVSLHLGDSRFYLFDKKNILWRSKDHSVVQLLIDQNEITEEEADTHPDRNRIYQCLGGNIKQTPDVQTFNPLNASQAIVICSDGFWHTLGHPQLNKLISASNLELQLQTLAQQAIDDAQGHSDNVTAIALRRPLSQIDTLATTKPIKKI